MGNSSKGTLIPNGPKITELRLRRGWSREDLSNESEVSLETIGLIEGSAEKKHRTFPRTMRILAETFGVSVPEITLSESRHAPSNDKSRRVLSLYRCRGDFMRWENGLAQSLPVTVKTLAIDLSYAWEHILAAINDSNATTIIFQILMLTGDSAFFSGDVPDIVRAWSKTARANLDFVKTEIKKYRGPKTVTIQIKQYCQVPTIHGVKGEKGSSARWWITKCRYSGRDFTNYGWGEGKYAVVSDHSDSQKLKDRAVKFDNLFSELWATSGKMVVNKTYGGLKRSRQAAKNVLPHRRSRPRMA